MVHHALRCATSTSIEGVVPTNTLWDPAPPRLTPPLPFVKQRIIQCLDAFLGREQQEWKFLDGLDVVLCEIRQLAEA